MPKHRPLPPEFEQGPFSVADARRFGISKHRIDGPDLIRPFHGVRTVSAEVSAVEDLCRSYLPRLGGEQFFSHITAARLWHLPLPQRFHPHEPLDIATMTRSDRPRCAGVRGHRLSNNAVRVVRLNGFPTSDAESTWCTLAHMLNLEDLVIVGDAIVFVPRYFDNAAPAPRPYATLQQLITRARSYRGPGKRMLGEALSLIRTGSASPMETRLRLLILRSGLPEPQLNVDIVDNTGAFVACGDLYYPEQRVLIEYDGDQHRTDTKTYERDQTRIANLRAVGVECIRVRKAGFFSHPEHTIAEIRSALLRAPR